MATRTSTLTDAAWAELTRNRKRAPSETPGGTGKRREWRRNQSPLPRQAVPGSAHVSPRPPQSVHVPRSVISSGTMVPSIASLADTEISAVSAPGADGSPRNPSRTRSTS